MFGKIRVKIKYFLLKLSQIFRKISNRIKLLDVVKQGENDFNVYKDRYGDLYRLNLNKYIDRCIVYDGVFEAKSIAYVLDFIKPGMICIDVGANFGYYTVKMSRKVTELGSVIAFEPTNNFYDSLIKNIKLNSTSNVVLEKLGLSNKQSTSKIKIGTETATIHWVEGSESNSSPFDEIIKLDTLDNYVYNHNIEKIDFIKVDIDGHEYSFLKGAESSLLRFRPVILIEISHLHYHEAGVDMEEFYTYILELGYSIYTEEFKKISNYIEFLISFGDFSRSSNAIFMYDN